MASVLTIALAAICAVVPFVIGQRHGVVRLVSPMHLLCYFCALGFLAKFTIYSFQPELAFYRKFDLDPSAPLLGAAYLSGFVLLMCCGYLSGIRRISSPTYSARLIAAGIERSAWLTLGAFTVALGTLFLILNARGASLFDASLLSGLNTAKQINVNDNGVGATLAGIKTLFIIPKFAFVLILARGIARRSMLQLMIAAALAGLLIVIALVSGDRFELIELLIYALATYLILGGRIGGRAIVVAAMGAAIVTMVSIYMTQLRLGHGSLVGQVFGSTYFLDINASVMITDQIKADQFLWGASYSWWSFGWVPRAFWFDKPAIDLGVYFKREVMQIYTGGAYNVTGPGEAFINFGWAGVSVGFVLGWVYRRIEEALLAPGNIMRFGSFLFYPMVFYPFVQATLQSSFSAFIVGAVAQTVLIVLMILLCVTRFRPQMCQPIGGHHAV
ncbi:O-antigen polymerase [Loktanella sp. S4079]|uniref:O-antigen polymerase n=1 Tax=Loktanella sp. S4079 TaxID=579483 RepID=UPI0005F9AA25|nr:O-antigen polymerase [Loktanella sp. S4079]KJZ20669.1 hypothetical protein TW80_07825 [Loktanella sp. S4079]